MIESYYPDINRAAVIIKLKKPFIDWLRINNMMEKE